MLDSSNLGGFGERLLDGRFSLRRRAIFPRWPDLYRDRPVKPSVPPREHESVRAGAEQALQRHPIDFEPDPVQFDTALHEHGIGIPFHSSTLAVGGTTLSARGVSVA